MNRKSLEPSDIAPTWVHDDVRSDARAYLSEGTFVWRLEELDGAPRGLTPPAPGKRAPRRGRRNQSRWPIPHGDGWMSDCRRRAAVARWLATTPARRRKGHSYSNSGVAFEL